MNLPSILFVLLTAGRLAVGTGLNCSAGTSRFGKSMRRVQPPLSCQGSPNMPSPTWCDEPGRDYPWQEIQEYLRRSSAAASKRAALPDASGMKRLLAKYRPGKSRAPGRRTRSTSDVYDVSGHRSPTRVARLASRSRNWEFSDDRPDATERLETAAPAVGDTANFGSPGAAQEGDRDDESETFLENVDYKGGFTEEEELAILFSYFTEPSGIVVTKGVLEDIIKLGEALDNALGWRQPATEAPPDDGPASVETSAASAQGASGEAAPQEHQPVGEAPLFHDGGAPKVSAPAQESVAVTEQPRLETLDAMPENSTDSPAAAHTTGPTAPPEPTTTLPPPAAAPTPSPSPPVAAQPAVDAPAPVTATASTSVFSEAERRSPPGPSQIRAEVRTGEDVLAEITAGEEILADALAAELEDWPREEPSAEDWRQEEQEDWTREEPSAEDWRQEEQEDWTREDRPPEVQYYLPPARSTVGVMETVYTDVIYRPEQEAVVTRPAAATTTARTTTTTTPGQPAGGNDT
ncbi:translation initiation factor IF-2-like [Pollicipes pollicipes]|uniref:translation initiation factor IF-2-like n=1 Tax=Pollicipes pollicipes TaxID=41117 RepID=UPI0018852C91|nr:translation initiation factor IF-2-like [Pollicipes pollicipes]